MRHSLVPLLLATVATVATVAACSAGSRGAATPVPQSMNASVAEFLTAVKANNLARMGQLWGTERGPAAQSMNTEELRRRLTVIQKYLDHTGYRVVEGPLLVSGRDDLRTFRVELQRDNCNQVMPIDVVRTRSGGWLVYDVHLETISPRCPAAGTQR